MKDRKKQNDDNSASSTGKGTFIIKVEYCRNNTWQGNVTWVDESKKLTFRSALELMKLMNGALIAEQAQGQQEEKHSVS